MRPVSTNKIRRSAAVTVLASLTLMAACAGENLFSLAAGVGGVGPSVDMTAPAEGFTPAVGDSVLVRASVNAPAGAITLNISSTYQGGGAAAYNPVSDALGSVSVISVNEWVKAAAGQVAGSAYIVVQVTDSEGAIGKDSVKVVIS